MSGTKEDASRPGGLVDDDGAMAAAFQGALGGRKTRRRREDRPAVPAVAEPSAGEASSAGAGQARAVEADAAVVPGSEDASSGGGRAVPEPAVAPVSAPAVAAEPTAPVDQAPDDYVVHNTPYFAPLEQQPGPAGPPAVGAGIPQQAPEPQAGSAAGTPESGPAAQVAVRRSPQPAPAARVSQEMVEHLVAQATAQVPGSNRSTQCTVNVSTSVRDRFAAYQTAKRMENGAEPTNAVVVRRAVLHARKHDLFARMQEYVRHRQAPAYEEDDDPDDLFGEAQGRRVERGRVLDSQQQTFRPTYKEVAVIDALAAAYGFANRSEFVDAALEVFLPPLPDKRRR